eukprot:5913220-Amphidinium_carterae.1
MGVTSIRTVGRPIPEAVRLTLGTLWKSSWLGEHLRSHHAPLFTMDADVPAPLPDSAAQLNEHASTEAVPVVLYFGQALAENGPCVWGARSVLAQPEG